MALFRPSGRVVGLRILQDRSAIEQLNTVVY
jgi:hypothetical protein